MKIKSTHFMIAILAVFFGLFFYRGWEDKQIEMQKEYHPLSMATPEEVLEAIK